MYPCSEISSELIDIKRISHYRGKKKNYAYISMHFREFRVFETHLYLHLNEIVEGLCFYFGLSLCVCVCLCVCVFVCQCLCVYVCVCPSVNKMPIEQLH